MGLQVLGDIRYVSLTFSEMKQLKLSASEMINVAEQGPKH